MNSKVKLFDKSEKEKPERQADQQKIDYFI